MSNMTLRQLEILRSVIKCQTTINAARELGLSQPAVSNAIKSMETRVGFALFERINSRLYPTPEAAVIYAESEAIFALHATMDVRIRDLQNTRAGTLTMLSTPPLGYSLVPRALKNFLKNRKGLRVIFEVRRFEHVIDSVGKSVVDLGFVLGFPNTPGMTSAILSTQRMVCVFQRGHPLTDKAIIRASDIRPYNLIGLEQNSRLGSLVRNSFEVDGISYDAAVEVRHGSTACVLAESGVGVAIVDPFSALSSNRVALEVRPFEPATAVTASVVWSKNREMSRVAKAFVRECEIALTSPPSLIVS